MVQLEARRMSCVRLIVFYLPVSSIELMRETDSMFAVRRLPC